MKTFSGVISYGGLCTENQVTQPFLVHHFMKVKIMAGGLNDVNDFVQRKDELPFPVNSVPSHAVANTLKNNKNELPALSALVVLNNIPLLRLK